MIKKGFSLIELAIVLVIAGVVMAGTIISASSAIDGYKVSSTNKKLDQIEKILYNYQLANAEMPCPADIDLPKSDSNFGISQETTDGTCLNNNYLPTGVYGGGVPTRTLGIPDDYMFDGWGNHIDYIVDAKAVSKTYYAPKNLITADGSFTDDSLSFKYGAKTAVANGELTIGGAIYSGVLSPIIGGQTYQGQIYKITADYKVTGLSAMTAWCFTIATAGIGCDATSYALFLPVYGKNEKYISINSAAAYVRFMIYNNSASDAKVIDNLSVRLVNAVPGSTMPIDIYDTTDTNGTASSVDSQDLINGMAVYVLVSHGVNGWGAYNGLGTQNTADTTGSTSEFEIENAHVGGTYDSEYRTGPFNDFAGATNYFDDIVRWKSYENLRFRESFKDKL